MTTQGKTSRLAAAGFGALWLLTMPALAQDAAPAAAADLSETLDERRSFASGADAWEKVCARCHTVEGDSKNGFAVGPDLSVNEYDADTLKFFVRNGYLAMPSFPAALIDDATLEELAAHVATNIYKGEAQ